MAEQLFGSDGARGPVDETGAPGLINPGTFEGLAFAYTNLVAEETGKTPTIIVGGDTRTSTPELAAAAARGAVAAGAEVWRVDAPTPTLGWLAKKNGVHAIDITASHNPDPDNGFKIFGNGGVKPDRKALDRVESMYWDQVAKGHITTGSSDAVKQRPELVDTYLDALVEKLGGEGALADKFVIVDGANGAASDLAPRLYRALGAEVLQFACDPNDVINLGCGATDLEGVKRFMAEQPEFVNDPRFIGAFANDGDADRVMGVDRNGNILNGNHWMYELAQGQEGIVGTLYTNSALRIAVASQGVDFYECDNGDSNVTAMLQELTAKYGEGYTRGGEFTGHLIDTDYLPSGDGIYMGGVMAVNLAKQGATLADVYASLPLWSEVMGSVRLPSPIGKTIAASEQVCVAEAAEIERYKDVARIILRPSGTEPKFRVWAEAKNEADAVAIVERLSGAVRSAITTAA